MSSAAALARELVSGVRQKSEAKLSGVFFAIARTAASQELGNDMLRSLRSWLPLVAAALLAGFAASAHAQDWPSRPVTVLVPFVTFMLFTRLLGIYLPNGILQAVI